MCLHSRLATNITGRAQLQHTSRFFVSKHKVLTEHLALNTLLTAKVIRYKSVLVMFELKKEKEKKKISLQSHPILLRERR